MENVVSEEAAADAPKRLTIDASIAFAAGKERPADATYVETTVVTPKNCRDVLIAVRRLGFGMTMTPEIMQEWDNHQRSFALTWRVAMTRAARVELMASCYNEDLRNRIEGMAGQKIGKIKITKEVCRIMLKDCHLVEAALDADRVVISLDDKVRFHFMAVSEIIHEIGPIVWVNPDKPAEEPFVWLETGAEPEKHRQLGFRQDSP